MMGEVVIIDYNAGNLFSVEHACLQVGLSIVVSSDKKVIESAKAIILPGVGAFNDAMNNLKKLDLISPLKDKVGSGTPLLGVCLGLQLLFTESEEFGNHKGLDLIEGSILKFPNQIHGNQIKVPQIGWNKIYANDKSNWVESPLNTIPEGEFMYFVHSFFANPSNKSEITTLTEYEGIEYCSSILKNNIFATQFHPEKSAKWGIEVYKNWANSINK
uniref:imidazole glycerol phosphate synthase subunit HisH n=1 Tax=Algoriphagus sp. TaxID=1872435 RepID=UPI0040479CD3